MPNTKFRLTESILTIEQMDSEHKPLTIPDGAIVRLVSRIEGSKFVQVEWDGKTTNMFEVDLRERATPVEAAAG